MDKHLSEVLKVEDLKTYGNKVLVISGLGSGKNHWVKHELTKYGKVLLITSRKAIVDQTLTEAFFTENANWNIDNVKACTYASIGQYVLKNPTPRYGINETVFDYIVIDEAHSLVSDATFTDAPFHVLQFIKNTSKPVILMSATASIIKDKFEELGFKVLDFSNKCINIKPKEVSVIKNDLVKDILSEASPTNKTIYMLPSASDAYSIKIEDFGGRNDIVVITSKDKLSEQEKKEKKLGDEVYDYIIKHERLPDHISILLTTTKLKEGINIRNTDIKMCITGCHTSVDLLQFAGRVREGIDILYIVADKKQNENTIKHKEIDASFHLLPYFNEVLMREYWKGFGKVTEALTTIDRCKDFIDVIEQKFDAIRFDNYTNEFQKYAQRIHAIQCENEDLKLFKEDRLNYLKSVFGDDVRITLDLNKELDEKQKNEISKIIAINLDKELDKEQQKAILSHLTDLGVTTGKGKPYKNLGSALNKLGYKWEYIGNKTFGKIKITLKYL